MNKPVSFKLIGQDAVMLNNSIEVSAPNEDIGSKILIRCSEHILDKHIKSLRINLPNKIIFVSAKDSQNLIVRAEHSNDKKVMN
jgi:hypothetical protein